MELLQDLRKGVHECLVGVNLLREGLDLPEVSLVAILDADKEGFLRSETSLIQTIGRSARNVNAKVILYADKVTASMKSAIEETNRRRTIQEKYNKKHGITPETIKKRITGGIESAAASHREATQTVLKANATAVITDDYVKELESEMLVAAENLEFERAAALRDRISQLHDKIGEPLEDVEIQSYKAKGKKGRRGKPTGKKTVKVPRPKKMN